MVQQAASHNELVESLAAVKDANKRLLEQISLQTEEISYLTQQRVCDEERLAQLKRKHSEELEIGQKNAHRRQVAAREAAGRRYTSEKQLLKDNLRHVRTRIELAGQDVKTLQEEHLGLRRDADAIRSSIEASFNAGINQVLVRSSSAAKAASARRKEAEEAIKRLEQQLASEREERTDEGLNWTQRHSSASADSEEAQARLARDLSQLSSQLEALERTSLARREAWEEDKAQLQRQLEVAKDRQVSAVESQRQAHHHHVDLESRLLKVESEIRDLEKEESTLHWKAKDSDEDLAAALKCNDHLRQQMEEQRKAFQDGNEEDLAAVRRNLERRSTAVKTVEAENSFLSSRRLKAEEEKLTDGEEVLRNLESQVVQVSDQAEELLNEASSWHARHDAVQDDRREIEERFADARRGAALERVRLQVGNDQLSIKVDEIEVATRRARDSKEELNRAASDKEADRMARLALAETQLRDEEAQLEELKRRCKEAATTRSRVDTEKASLLRRTQAEEENLLQLIDTRKCEMKEQRERLEEELKKQKRALEEAQSEFDEELELNHTKLARTQDEQKHSVESAELARSRAEESCQEDLKKANEVLSKQQKLFDSLEHDVTRVRQLLSESESNATWIHQEVDLEDDEAARELRTLKEEVDREEQALEKAMREDSLLSTRMQEDLERQERERQSLTKELMEIRHENAMAKDASLRIPERRFERLPSDTERDLHHSRSLDMSFASGHRVHTLDRSLDEEALEKENSQLRSFLAEQGRTSAGLAMLHNKLEQHIDRLHRHTEELRGSLDSNGPSSWSHHNEASLHIEPIAGPSSWSHHNEASLQHRLIEPIAGPSSWSHHNEASLQHRLIEPIAGKY
eukprot:TRINITY_DN3203_c0_g1_i1.p1 TRINITY_DN3203_c0_g1~~TRINITY_DN3203_c0_g1_i1.p1  ORF type:complete len:993 (-),score=250.67 TRINITY_DN3203_c0_g1_i1:211-2805(-)